MPRVNVLISSAGRRVALLRAFERSLSSLGLEGDVMAADASKLSAACAVAARAFRVPRCDAPEFVPALVELCRAHEVTLVVPTIDTELPILAEHRERFADVGTTVVVSSSETVAIAGDKERTHAWLEREGFPTVRQGSLAEAIADPLRWPFPLIVKPRSGSASQGVARVDSREELEVAGRRGDIVVQTIAPGNEHTIDVLVNRRGQALCAVPRRRIEVRAGEVSKGVTVRCDRLAELGCKVCERLPGAFGPLTVQAFLDDAGGDARVIEINPRFGGGYPLSWEAGAAFPRWIIEDVLGLPSTAAPDGWRDGLVMLRYDEAVFAAEDELGL